MPVLNDDVWGMIFSFLVEGRGPRCAEVDEAAFAAGIAAAGSGGARGRPPEATSTYATSCD